MVDALKKKQTITLIALRLGTFRLVFFRIFFSIWLESTMASSGNTCPWSDQNSRQKYLSGWIFALCVSTNIIHFSIAGPLARLWWSEIPARWLDLLL